MTLSNTNDCDSEMSQSRGHIKLLIKKKTEIRLKGGSEPSWPEGALYRQMVWSITLKLWRLEF